MSAKQPLVLSTADSSGQSPPPSNQPTTDPSAPPFSLNYADMESFDLMDSSLPPDFDLAVDHDLMDPSSFFTYDGFDQDFTADAADSTAFPDPPPEDTSAQKPLLKSALSMPNIKPAEFSKSQETGAADGAAAAGTASTPNTNTRKRIPPEKTLILENSFKENPKPDRDSRDVLAKETGLPLRNIQVSFWPR